MNCDDAFDRLTAPGGSDDPQLTAHLARCMRCRGMAETLAPAIELFAAPTTNGPDSLASATAIARQSAARLAQRSGSERLPPSRLRRTALLIAAAMGGAACCFVAIRLAGGDPSPSAASCPRNSPAASEWMERNALPVAMACVACHPIGAGQLAPVTARPATALGGAL